jgi:sigma-E factor negative regulatory protein RseC
MSKKIEHTGIIRHIEGNKVKVEIIQMSACSSCHAKGACTAADMDEKIIDAHSNNPNLKVGDAVNIYGESGNGLLAVLLAFVIPFTLILISLIVTGHFIQNEAISGLISLLVLVPYFIILSLFNNKLKKKFTFYISDI